MGRRRALELGLMTALAVGGTACERDSSSQDSSSTTARVFPHVEAEREPEPFAKIGHEQVEAIEVLMFEEPVGEGYRRVKARLGPPLYSSRKWLGLAKGEGRMLGPHHVVINVYAERPKDLWRTPITTNLILDVRSGEVVTEFAERIDEHWLNGLLLAKREGEPRPQLFDAETGRWVSALPDGEHDWELGRNYWLRFSGVAKRVWVMAKEAEGIAHLYAWEPLSEPPERPNNPVPFLPERWDPDRNQGRTEVREEVVRDSNFEDCTRAVLEPPKGFECLSYELASSVPLSEGWRLSATDEVFNTETGEGYDLQSLCPLKGHNVVARVEQRSPPRVQLRCGSDMSSWMRWVPPNRVYVLEPELAKRINKDLYLWELEDDGAIELKYSSLRSRTVSWLDEATKTRVLVRPYGACESFVDRGYAYRYSHFAVGCETSSGRASWFELLDNNERVRGRVDARELIVGPNGQALALTRSNGTDTLVLVDLVLPN